MKYIVFILAVLIVSPALALDKTTEVEILRLENQIRKLQEVNKQLLKDMRILQRESGAGKKTDDKVVKELNKMSDELLSIRNNEIANLQASQKKLYSSIPVFDWGNSERGCKSINSKHQQIKSITRNDGALTIRYVCFDGQVLHLGTEVNSAP
jgi:chromosome segregation ATPase